MTDMPDERLHTVLVELLAHGPQDVGLLTRRARRLLRDPRIDDDATAELVATSALLVGRADGSVIRLLDVLEGQVLTHRVDAAVAGRTDLWTGLALQPLLTWCTVAPIPLASGGSVQVGSFAHPALVGPPGWLPGATPGSLLGFRVVAGELDVAPVADEQLGDLRREVAVRTVLARHYRREQWWSEDDLADRPGELDRALAHALLQDPDLLRVPVAPLDELLHDPLHQGQQDHQFRDMSAWERGEVVSFGVSGMPEALFCEIGQRAAKFGMSADQYIVAALGHLAWRTPFAEDLGPWESWDVPGAVDPPRSPTPLRRVT